VKVPDQNMAGRVKWIEFPPLQHKNVPDQYRPITGTKVQCMNIPDQNTAVGLTGLMASSIGTLAH
jgi:hypothetical protein